MIIPIRCFTCHKVIADKWEAYKKLTEANSKHDPEKKFTLEDITINDDEDPMRYFDKNDQKEALEKLGIKKMCFIRHFISHVDLIDII
jgi:DNA-directed RNA polymerase subunit N (RpoN/RPB10)